MDPAPENVEGRLVQKHTFHHEVNWGYIAVAAGLLIVAYVAWNSGLVSTSDDEEEL